MYLLKKVIVVRSKFGTQQKYKSQKKNTADIFYRSRNIVSLRSLKHHIKFSFQLLNLKTIPNQARYLIKLFYIFYLRYVLNYNKY